MGSASLGLEQNTLHRPWTHVNVGIQLPHMMLPYLIQTQPDVILLGKGTPKDT